MFNFLIYKQLFYLYFQIFCLGISFSALSFCDKSDIFDKKILLAIYAVQKKLFYFISQNIKNHFFSLLY